MPSKHPTKAILVLWIIMAAGFFVAMIGQLAQGEGLDWIYIVLVVFGVAMAAYTWLHLRNGSQD